MNEMNQSNPTMKEKTVSNKLIIFAIICVVVILPIVYLYTINFAPFMKYEMIKHTKAYYALLAEQDYQSASELIWILSEEKNQLVSQGSSVEWLEKFSLLEESSIEIRGIRNIRFYHNDTCPALVIDVVIRHQEQDVAFRQDIGPIPRCSTATSLETILLGYNSQDRSIIGELADDAKFVTSSVLTR